MKRNLTTLIFIGMVVGVAVGYGCHRMASPETVLALGGYFQTITTVFLRLVQAIIAPLVFATLVAGVAALESGGSVKRIAVQTIAWFMCASLLSLMIGLFLANVLAPGAGLHMVRPAHEAGSEANGKSLQDFVSHAFPFSVVDAMARNDILQILVFSLLFGLALRAGKADSRVAALLGLIEGIVPAMLRVTEYVMKLAPLGVFGALASAITVHGLDVLGVYGKLVAGFYFGLMVLCSILIGIGYAFLGGEIWVLLRAVKEPAVIAFSTASSEAAYPRLMEKLERFGVDKKIVGFTLPLGYAFNLDGSMLYQAFAAVFIAQAFDIDMSLGTQIVMLLVLMISSKGMAGVARGSVMVVAAVGPMFNLPPSGVLLILAIDQVLDMGRTATNVIGNSIATAVIASRNRSGAEKIVYSEIDAS
jgi:Na+/H+-dicarboxylate symporter